VLCVVKEKKAEHTILCIWLGQCGLSLPFPPIELLPPQQLSPRTGEGIDTATCTSQTCTEARVCHGAVLRNHTHSQGFPFFVWCASVEQAKELWWPASCVRHTCRSTACVSIFVCCHKQGRHAQRQGAAARERVT